MSTLKKLLAKRQHLCEEIQYQSTKAAELTKQDPQYKIKRRSDTLECLYGHLEENFKAIEGCKEEVDINQISKDTHFYEELFLDAMSHISTLTLLPLVNNSEPSTSMHVKSEFKLPQITVPNFSGKFNEWQSFHDLFGSLIHNNPTLSGVQKLHYLKNSLTGEAAQIIRHLNTTDNNYDVAWQLLINRYLNKRATVNAHLKILMNQPVLHSENAQLLRKMLDTTNESIEALKTLNMRIEHWDAWLVFIIVQKMDQKTHEGWEHSLKASKEVPTMAQLQEYLETRISILEEIYSNARSGSIKSNPRPGKPVEHKALHTKTYNCSICSEEHLPYSCPTLQALPIEERTQLIKEKKLCFNCLFGGHRITDCKSKYSCKICHKKHNTLLHIKKENNDEITPYTERDEENAVASNHANVFHEQQMIDAHVLLATALVPVKDTYGNTVILRALIDQGSQANFLTSTACQQLDLEYIATHHTISGINNTKCSLVKKSTEIILSSIYDKEYALNCEVLILQDITRIKPFQHTKPDFAAFRHLKLADPEYHKPGRIDLLLGAEIYANILLHGLIKGNAGSLIAQHTKLGWILSGMCNDTTEPRTNSQCHIGVISSNDAVNNQLQKFWEIEEISPSKGLSKDEEIWEEAFKNGCQRRPDGKYQLTLPFNCDSNQPDFLGASRPAAFARLMQVERKLERNPELRNQYNTFLKEYLDLGHMRQLSQEESNSNYRSNILPHHAVLKESSTTTKLRVVFDGSCKTSNGFSLNDRLLIGTTIQNELTDILLKWRTHQYAFTADIEKMYRQIYIDPNDTTFQKILWRFSTDEPIKEYALSTVTYGTASAPYQAIPTMHQLADDERESFPETAQIIKTDFYVDDIMSGSDNLENAIKLQTELIELLRRGGFNLRKWASNTTELLENIPEEHREVQLPLEMNQDETIKALGIHWHPQIDKFSFKVNLGPAKIPATKRSFLSDVSKLFDPHGWLAPCIIKAKIMLQFLWTTGIHWDDSLPTELHEKWIQLRNEFSQLETLRIDRWLGITTSNQGYSLHGFCDASEQAYAAAVYLRVENDPVHTILIIAKTKVAPIKRISLPRLELCGAALLAKLIQHTRNVLNIADMPTYAWTDSTIVLAWLRNIPSRWKTFVANRVTQIHETLTSDHWYHVSSHDNPADCASRGIVPDQLNNHPLWWTGPTWLRESEDKWPTQNHKEITNIPEERKSKVVINTIIEDELEIVERFSSINRLLRVTAQCLRFIQKCRKISTNTSHITIGELNRALQVWIQQVQLAEFKTEITQLKNRQRFSSKSKLLSLCPMLDKNNIMRVGGRLEHSQLPQNTKHPIILPSKGHFTRLIIEDAHKITLHGGTQLTLQFIRSKYWILNGRNTVKQVIHKCIRCYRYRAQPNTQLMADLPSARVTPAPAFQHSGVDYAGPIEIKTSNRRNAPTTKAYISLFVCLSTKAIHLELVSDLTTNAFIAAFRRFCSRRGVPSDLYSDQGTNFVGASTELPRLLEQSRSQKSIEIIKQLISMGTTWHFNPPLAPHFGGLWEAGVKSTKYHLKRVIGNNKLTFEELTTFLYQVEACLNSRPLCPLTEEIDSLEVLTPGHFLIGRQLNTVPEPSLLEINENRLDKWQLLQRMQQQFWKKWTKEYLHTLQQRSKWQQTETNLQIGDLVLIKEDNLPPSKWLLGRITNVITGDNNLIRVVEIKTKNSIITRPIHKLCRLPIDNK